MGGGYPKGSIVLWDIGENVPFHAFAPFIVITECNFANLNRLVVVLPTKGVDAVFKKKLHEGYINREAFGRNMFIVQYAIKTSGLEPYMIELTLTLKCFKKRFPPRLLATKRIWRSCFNRFRLGYA